MSVRRVTECSGDGLEGYVTFRVAAGEAVGVVNTISLAEFTHWQRYEVIFKNGDWHRIRHSAINNPH
jgi:hypothetical protein